jgi:hypothetical protein
MPFLSIPHIAMARPTVRWLPSHRRFTPQESEVKMIFDILRQISRTWLIEIRPIVEATHLIHLPIKPHHILPRHQSLETLSRVFFTCGKNLFSETYWPSRRPMGQSV